MSLTRSTRAFAISVPLALAMTGSLAVSAQAAPTLVSNDDIQVGGYEVREADSGWWHGPYVGNVLEGPSVGEEVVDTEAVDAAGDDAQLLNGSLRMTRTAEQQSRLEYPTAKPLADLVGTDPATTPRFSAYAADPDNDATIGLGFGIFCNASSETPTWGGTFTLLATPNNTWKEHAWPVVNDDTVPVHSSHAAFRGDTTMAKFAEVCPDAGVVYATLNGGRDKAADVYVDKVSFDGKSYDFGEEADTPEPLSSIVPVTSLAAGDEAVAPDESNRLVMQADGNLVAYDADGKPTFNTQSFVPGSRLAVQDDGNVVIYGPDGRWLWQSGTVGNADATVTVEDGDLVVRDADGEVIFDSATDQGLRNHVLVGSLNSGAATSSLNGRYRLVMQTDGNLVVYRVGTAVWSSGTHGNPGARLVVQDDGNAVIYQGNRALWSTGTHANPTARMVLQDDGNLVVYRANSPLWWSMR